MPPRKDLVRIIRTDESFAATLGFGGTTPSPTRTEDPPVPQVSEAQHASADPATPIVMPETGDTGDPAAAPGANSSPDKRGVVIYVAVSLTEAQAIRAERWAAAASCPVHLLMRRTAQAMRKELFGLWATSGVDHVEEFRGARGRHPTSLTLTLSPQLAAAFSAQLDPMAVIGLGRAIGPAFRMRFEAAFDAAAQKAGF